MARLEGLLGKNDLCVFDDCKTMEIMYEIRLLSLLSSLCDLSQLMLCKVLVIEGRQGIVIAVCVSLHIEKMQNHLPGPLHVRGPINVGSLYKTGTCCCCCCTLQSLCDQQRLRAFVSCHLHHLLYIHVAHFFF